MSLRDLKGALSSYSRKLLDPELCLPHDNQPEGYSFHKDGQVQSDRAASPQGLDPSFLKDISLTRFAIHGKDSVGFQEVSRKPPKGSVKDQLASIQRLEEELRDNWRGESGPAWQKMSLKGEHGTEVVPGQSAEVAPESIGCSPGTNDELPGGIQPESLSSESGPTLALSQDDIWADLVARKTKKCSSKAGLFDQWREISANPNPNVKVRRAVSIGGANVGVESAPLAGSASGPESAHKAFLQNLKPCQGKSPNDHLWTPEQRTDFGTTGNESIAVDFVNREVSEGAPVLKRKRVTSFGSQIGQQGSGSMELGIVQEGRHGRSQHGVQGRVLDGGAKGLVEDLGLRQRRLADAEARQSTKQVEGFREGIHGTQQEASSASQGCEMVSRFRAQGADIDGELPAKTMRGRKLGDLLGDVQEHISAYQGDVASVPEDGEDDVKIEPREDVGALLQCSEDGSGPAERLVVWPPSAWGEVWDPGKAGLDAGQEGEVVELPACINSRLLPHQRDGVRFMYRLYREKRGGILGDDMGLGKTVQAIAFLTIILQKTGGPEDFYAARKLPPPRAPEGPSLRKTDIFDDATKFGRAVLIVAPTSVLQNWVLEFEAWGSFRVGVYHGQQREGMMERVLSSDLEVVLTSFDTFRLFAGELLVVDWHCVLVDEAHRLKNENSKTYEACMKMRTLRRFGLTGTVMQNKYSELFAVFDWAAPGCLGSRTSFREYYDEPLKQGQRINAPASFVAQAEQRKARLVAVLRGCLLRRTKEGTIGHLLQGKEDNVVFCAMAPLQRHVYRRMLRSPDFQLLSRKDEPCSCGGPASRGECCHKGSREGEGEGEGPLWASLHPSGQPCDRCPYCLVLPCLLKLQQVSNHVELIKPNPRDPPEKQARDQALAELVLAEEAEQVGGVDADPSFLGMSAAQHCGKMLALEKLLQAWTWDGDKVLLFSYSTKMLAILDRFLVRRGYCFQRLEGSTPMAARQALVDEFNRSPSMQIFLISTRAGGLGLNLTSANRVVIFDPNWNPAYDLQAQDRSFRFGQQRHVTVYRLLSAGSLEELVYTRQVYKQQLANMAMAGATEKRYFAGVQGSKAHPGELFGIGNLFKDQSDALLTSDIIEGHEQRMLRIARDRAVDQARDRGQPGRRRHLAGQQETGSQEEGEEGPGMVLDEEVDVRGIREVAKELEREARGGGRGAVRGAGEGEGGGGGEEAGDGERSGGGERRGGGGGERGNLRGLGKAESGVGTRVEEGNGGRGGGPQPTTPGKRGRADEGTRREAKEEERWERRRGDHGPPLPAEEGEPLRSALEGAGVVYAHRNEKIVNLTATPNVREERPSKERSSVQQRGAGGRGSHGGSSGKRTEGSRPKQPLGKAGLWLPPKGRRVASETAARGGARGGRTAGAVRGGPPEAERDLKVDGGMAKESHGDTKHQTFEAMAAWKGMTVAAFSQLIKSLSSEARKQLLSEYNGRASTA